MGFVKIYDSILRSSIWLESPSTKLVWITMLVLADKDGFVRASVGGLAHQAGVPRGDCVEALGILESPDPDSQTATDEGRRVTRHDGGWSIVNHSKYREMRTERQVQAAERSRKYRENKEKKKTGSERDASRESRAVTRGDARSASASASSKGGVGETQDSDSLQIPCPSEMLPDSVVAELAVSYGSTEATIREAIRECVSYWTVGAGAGRRRTRGGWMRAAREDLRRKSRSGALMAASGPETTSTGAVLSP